MKTIATVMTLILSGFSLTSQASDGWIDVENISAESLQVDLAAVSVAVSYPGKEISGICGVEIRADSWGRVDPIEKFVKAVNIASDYNDICVTVKDAITVDVDLPHSEGLYMAAFTVKTKNGKSLKEVIRQTLGDNRTVVLIGRSCP
jgi:hypothetical protein